MHKKNMATKKIYKFEDERITSDSIAHKTGENTYKNLEKYLNDNKIKTVRIDFTINPSTNRGSMGYGEQTIDISELNVNEIISLTYAGGSNFMLYGCTSNLKGNPKELSLYGYRTAGTYNANISGVVYITYF